MQPEEHALFERQCAQARQEFETLKALRAQLQHEENAGDALQARQIEADYRVHVQMLRSVYAQLWLWKKGGADSAEVESAMQTVVSYFHDLGEPVPRE
jgi:hypothetical protein